MAITSTSETDKLILTIDNGDFIKINEILKKWSFKDHQSLLRFAMSLLILNEDNYVTIKLDGEKKDMVPSQDLLRS